MPLWLFLLLAFGGIMVMGIIVDWVMKRRKRKLHMDAKQSNEHAEQMLNDTRENHNDNNFFL
ncbi:hypothetical protein [Brevibacillus sp. H7]|uniref:hypothetical protein n=1 Tax=Brevibacillus sp. H7 TaxID=3349138 RepID=UPI003813F214